MMYLIAYGGIGVSKTAKWGNFLSCTQSGNYRMIFFVCNMRVEEHLTNIVTCRTIKSVKNLQCYCRSLKLLYSAHV